MASPTTRVAGTQRARILWIAAGLIALALSGMTLPARASAGLIVDPSHIPLGSWSDTVAHCQIGWCKGQDFDNPTTITAYDPVSGSFAGIDATSFTVKGKMRGSTLTMTATQGSYVSHSKGKINPDGSSWSGTWTDSNHVGGTWDGTRVLQHSTYFDGRWVLTSMCTKGKCPNPATTKGALVISGVDSLTGLFKGTLGTRRVVGQVDTSHSPPVISFLDAAPASRYRGTYAGGLLSSNVITGGTWIDSAGRSGSWSASLVDNRAKICGKSTARSCTGVSETLTYRELQTCVSYWQVCDGFGGRTGNPLLTCVASIGAACYGFGGMTPNQVETCISLVSDCGGFAGMKPNQIETCVSYWSTCTGFGGMKPPEIQTCVGNVGGACQGFGPATQSQLQACVGNVAGACEGFGPPAHAQTITPDALNPWTLDCGSDQYSGFLFKKIKCKDTITVSTRSLTSSIRAHAQSKRTIVLGKVIAVVGANDIVSGRLPVLNPDARTYLSRLAQKNRPVTLHIALKVRLLRDGKAVGNGPQTFNQTVQARVTA